MEESKRRRVDDEAESEAMESRVVAECERALRVVVVGAGLAGLAAARELRRLGAKVTVVEARSRVGGRCASTDIGGVMVDMGASWIHGVRKNPLYELAAAARLTPVDTGDDAVLWRGGQKMSGTRADAEAYASFNRLLGDARRRGDDAAAAAAAAEHARLKVDGRPAVSERHATDLSLGSAVAWADDALVKWHRSNLEYANAAGLDELSLRHWDQDDAHAFAGAHCVLREGFGALAAALVDDVTKNFEVASIAYAAPFDARARRACQDCGRAFVTGAGLATHVKACPVKRNAVVVTARDGRVVEADAAVVTLPLGVLKARTVEFVPELPAFKTAAIDRLGFGALDKIALRFTRAFWPASSLFGRASEDDDAGEFFLWIDMQSVLGAPVLVALTPANQARHLREKYNLASAPPVAVNDDSVRRAPPQLVARSIEALRRALGGTHEHGQAWLEMVVEAKISSWCDDPRARGTYSFLRPGATPADVDALAAPVGLDACLHFAGEATSRTHLATAAGAMLSGVDAARRLARARGLLGIGDVGEDKEGDLGTLGQSDLVYSRRMRWRRLYSPRAFDALLPDSRCALCDLHFCQDASVALPHARDASDLQRRVSYVEENNARSFVAGEVLAFQRRSGAGCWLVHDYCAVVR